MLLKGSELNHYRSTEDILLDIYLTTNSVKLIISFLSAFHLWWFAEQQHWDESQLRTVFRN